MDNGFHMIGLYATFVFAIIIFVVMPFMVIKYVRKHGRKNPTDKD